MILTGKDGNIWRRSCPTAILSTTNPARNGLELQAGLCGKRLATNRLSQHGTAFAFLLHTAKVLKSHYTFSCIHKYEKKRKGLHKVKI
jgi:hypothetical protein